MHVDDAQHKCGGARHRRQFFQKADLAGMAQFNAIRFGGQLELYDLDIFFCGFTLRQSCERCCPCFEK
ncbi:MAG: hypothetical protein WBD59_14795 [Candidatus Sulfotelmatobacter sp.]